MKDEFCKSQNCGHYIYKAIDHSGSIIYIGITNCIESRMAQHRLTSEWWKCFNKIHYALLENKKAAELLEVLMINEFRPKFNATHNREADLSLLSYNGAGLTWLDFDSFIKPKVLTKFRTPHTPVITSCWYVSFILKALIKFNAKVTNSEYGFCFFVDFGFRDHTIVKQSAIQFGRCGFCNLQAGWDYGDPKVAERFYMHNVFETFKLYGLDFICKSDLVDLLELYDHFGLPYDHGFIASQMALF